MLEDKLKTIEQLKQELLKQQNKFTEMEVSIAPSLSLSPN